MKHLGSKHRSEHSYKGSIAPEDAEKGANKLDQLTWAVLVSVAIFFGGVFFFSLL